MVNEFEIYQIKHQNKRRLLRGQCDRAEQNVNIPNVWQYILFILQPYFSTVNL